jgi:amino acid transporter
MAEHAAPSASPSTTPDTGPDAAPTLVRTIGRWSLTATIVNAVVGSAIFGMPATVAGLTGAWSPLAVLVAGIGMFPIVLCFAEVGSRFDAAGGPYLYAREAFGRVAGFHVGWLMLWTRLLSGGAVLNVMVTYLSQLVPWVGTTAGRATTMTAAVVLVTGINILGVRQAAWTVNVFTVAKLLPLLLLAVLGLVRLDDAVLATQQVAAPDWTEAVLLLVFAYGGFESAVSAAGETRKPREDTAFALVTAILLITAVYSATQLAVVGLLPNAAASKAPVADALQATMRGGLVLGSLTAVVSTYGWLTGFGLLVPRVPYAMALRGELPLGLARVHPGFRTPHVSILACSALILALGLYGSFAATATLSAISRLVVYGITCAALFALRRPGAPAAGYQLPAGHLVAVLGIAFSVWLLSTRSFAQAWLVGAIMLAGVVVHWLAPGAPRAPGGAPAS